MSQSLYKWRRCAPPGQAHARTPTAVGKVRTEAALPAEPLRQSPAFTVALPFPVRLCRSVATAHLLYHFLAYLSCIAPFVPTPEIVEEQQFSVVHTDTTDHIIFHNVGYEKLR